MPEIAHAGNHEYRRGKGPVMTAAIVAHGEGARSGGIFFHDPDGTRLEIFSPTVDEGLEAPVEGAPTCGFF
ncbi:hypothetical protein SAVIM338S_02651 [Streptomyces avidinii]